MILGIVSDTHGHVESTRAALRMLESCQVEEVIHCGDIGSAEIVDLFARWPTHFVLGNVDFPEAPLRRAIAAARQHDHHRFGSLELMGRRVAFLHGDDFPLLAQTIDGGDYHLVCHGHTHVRRLERRGETIILNPGALHRANPHSIAIARLPELEITHIAL